MEYQYWKGEKQNMKKAILITLLLLQFISCKEKKPKNIYYKNLDTGEILNASDFEKKTIKLYEKYKNNSKKVKLTYSFKDELIISDSLIKTFKIDIRIGNEYVISSSNKEKVYNYINRRLPSYNLVTLDKEKVNFSIINGKPTMINIWHTACKPCIEEMPLLNKLKEKYKGKVNFYSITFNNEKEVNTFLEKKKFNFQHIINADNYLDEIGIIAYPKNIFLDKNGIVIYVEGPIPNISGKGKYNIENNIEFEEYINELLLYIN